jgi:DNA-binding transcriptional LysR family regulator
MLLFVINRVHTTHGNGDQNMDDVKLKYFLSVAKYLNFTEAAKDHYMTQPAISRQISELERDLGTKLFHRSTRTVTLTKSGELFLEDAKRILSLAENARERILLADSTEDLELKIIYLASPTRTFLPELVRQFHINHPQVSIDLHSKTAQEIADDIKNPTADIYFSMSSDLKQHKSMITRNLFTDTFCFVCRNDHPCLNGSSIDPEKIASEPFLMFQAETAAYMNRQILKVCRELNFIPKYTKTYNSMDDVILATECGLGISILPYKTRFYAPESISCIPINHQTPGSTIGIAWIPDSDNPAISWFLDQLDQLIEANPAWF